MAKRGGSRLFSRFMTIRTSKIVQAARAWPRRVCVTLACIVVLLLGARIALPYVVKHLVNERLERIPNYTGHVDDVDIQIWRGAYRFEGFFINRQSGLIQEPFFRARKIDVSLVWRELWHRRVVSDIRIDEGQLTFVQGPNPEATQTDLDRRWQDVIRDIFPIDITYLEITDGLLRYINNAKQPKADLFVTHMRMTAVGLRNRPDPTEEGALPAKITVEGESLGGGILKLVLHAEPLAAQPHFHLSLKLDRADLPSLNDSLRAYANVDVGRGTLQIVAEMAGKDGGFRGYVKPFFENLDFKNIKDEDKGIAAQIWEKLVAGMAILVKDGSRDQVATRIPFEGRFGDAKVGLFATFVNLFRHGFIQAFNPTIEGSVKTDNVLPNGKSAEGNGTAKKEPDDLQPKDKKR